MSWKNGIFGLLRDLLSKLKRSTVTVKCALEVSPRCRTPPNCRRFSVKVTKCIIFSGLYKIERKLLTKAADDKVLLQTKVTWNCYWRSKRIELEPVFQSVVIIPMNILGTFYLPFVCVNSTECSLFFNSINFKLLKYKS